MSFDEALKALGVDPNSTAADLIASRHHAGNCEAMWDAANKAKRRPGDDADGAGQFKNFDQLYNDRLKGDPAIPGNDNDGAGKFKNFDQLWDERLKDDPAIPKSAKAGLKDLPRPELRQTYLEPNIYLGGTYNRMMNGESAATRRMPYKRGCPVVGLLKIIREFLPL